MEVRIHSFLTSIPYMQQKQTNYPPLIFQYGIMGDKMRTLIIFIYCKVVERRWLTFLFYTLWKVLSCWENTLSSSSRWLNRLRWMVMWCGRRECVGYTNSFEGIWLITVMENMVRKAWHNGDFGYWIMMDDTGILPIKSRYMEWLISDVTEIKLHSNIRNWSTDSHSVKRITLIQSWEKIRWQEDHLTLPPTPTWIGASVATDTSQSFLFL